ncbi:Uncharacterised protein [Klebsiella pneumoniae]|nr:Uncharacterised protein [Klebsiella pneumoniae]SVV36722.1 Uncharacterised protein [Klebsiella pneumoniae]
MTYLHCYQKFGCTGIPKPYLREALVHYSIIGWIFFC